MQPMGQIQRRRCSV